jgi:hypothetical protein
MISAARRSGARIDIIAPQRFSPGLRAAIEEALRPPNQANMFTQEEIIEIYECGVAEGRYERDCEQRSRDSEFGTIFWCSLAFSIAWGTIGLVAGYLWAG